MNKTSLLMLIVGTILGIVIGYVTFSAKPEYNIEAEGFRNINFKIKEKKFNIDITQRIDADNVEIVKNIQLPVDGFVKGYHAMGKLFDELVAQGVLAQSPEADSP